jgi:alanyl-tRNA synthetase
MVVKNDPTLMFTNAGMNQFKDIFLGNTVPKTKRATDSQKCLRVSGKHNDLEEVGHDSYHHTMFEMLGNWSFGDYFKTEAIDWAWELLTDVYKIDKERLYATVFKGDEKDGTGPDEEAKQTWLKHLPAERILPGDKHDNFWEMGDTGPCGPCSEIHIDLRDDTERSAIPGKDLVNKSNPLVIEIWNLVFMQYNRKADGSLEPLPARNIDTGMGFERLCMVLQGKKSNYDTDVFSGIIHKIEELSGHKYHESEKTDIAMKVIADHIRAITFSIADGQLPSNVKAGYVIRRILRRAVRYGYTFLGFNEPFLCRLASQVADDMGDAYPEIRKQLKLIENVIREEEMAFLRTLDRGIKMLDDQMRKSVKLKTISGTDAFLLYDTYGFPIDLTELIASENGFSVDMEGFGRELDKQKERARNATSNEFGDWTEYHNAEEEIFMGYDYTDLDGVHLLKQRTVKSKNKTMFQLVFDRTPFYAEMGGQIGDTGYIISENGEKTAILDTIKENNLTIHVAEKIPSDCSGTFSLHVDAARRTAITNNHTATHLLDNALRSILGKHVEQKGSYVGPDYFRFDFSHFSKMADSEIAEAEKKVNALIRADLPLEENRSATMDEAKAMGAIALFGEKYGDKVRVVKFGNSIELCGGTHTSSTGHIGLFKIVSESAIAAGVRRIEAVTGNAAENYISGMQETLKESKELLNNPADLAAGIKKIMEENTDLKKKLESVIAEKTEDLAVKMIGGIQETNGMKIISFTDEEDPSMVKNAAAIVRKKAKGCIIAGAFIYNDKPNLVLMYPEEMVAAGRNAGKDIREAAKLIQGGGGGQPGLASAGGKNAQGLGQALEDMICRAAGK